MNIYFRYFACFSTIHVCILRIFLQNIKIISLRFEIYTDIDIPSFFQYFLIFLLNVQFSFRFIEMYFMLWLAFEIKKRKQKKKIIAMLFIESHYFLFNSQFISIVHSYRETGLLAQFIMVFMLEENRNNENRYNSMKSCIFNYTESYYNTS